MLFNGFLKRDISQTRGAALPVRTKYYIDFYSKASGQCRTYCYSVDEACTIAANLSKIPEVSNITINGTPWQDVC